MKEISNNDKSEQQQRDKNFFPLEQIYKVFSGEIGFPTMKQSGSKHIVVEPPGRSLSEFMDDLKQMNLKTVLMIADQLLCRIELMHEKGFIHRNIEPRTCVMGKRANFNQVCFWDLHRAIPYINFHTGKHIPFSENNKFVGSLIFSSANAHCGNQLSRRDDLESIAYLLIYLYCGSLPWSSYARPADVYHSKINTSTNDLCAQLPKEFKIFINHVKCLNFEDKPKYAEYRKLFRDLFIREGFVFDYKYEWGLIMLSRSMDSIGDGVKIIENNINKTCRKLKQYDHKKTKRHHLLIYPTKI